MDDKPSKKDADLLDRLNALKPSSVQLGKGQYVIFIAICTSLLPFFGYVC